MTKKTNFNYRAVRVHLPLHPNVYKLINQLHMANIRIRNVKITNQSISFDIARAALPTLRALRKKYKVKIKIQYAHNEDIVRLDLTTVFGLILLMVLPIIFSQWVWQVKVDSDIPELKVRIEKTLQHELQLKPPFYKGQLPEDMAIRQLLLEKHRDLAWVHIQKSGSIISFMPQLAPELVELPKKTEKPMHLVAAKNGVITHFNIDRGVRQVAPNATVYEGDLLVSGIMTNGDAVHVIGASGEVYADYWLECSFVIPRTVELVGQRSTSWHVVWKWLDQGVFNKSYYNEMSLPSIISPYVKIIETQVTTTVKREITEDTVKQLVMPLLHQKIVRSLPLKTIVKKQNLLHVQIDDDTVKGKVLFLINENIAKTQPVNQGE